MDKTEFKEAQSKLGLEDNKEMAKAMGLGVRSIEKYRSGEVTVKGPGKKLVKLWLWLKGKGIEIPEEE